MSDEISAADFLKQLSADPEYKEMLKRKEASRMAIVQENLNDAKSVICDLAKVGVRVQHISDLTDSHSSYLAAVPVLIKHLVDVPHRPDVREAVVRALCTPVAAGSATETLLGIFRSSESEKFKWVVANAIVATASEHFLPTILDLLNDNRHGKARGPLVGVAKYLDKQHAKALIYRSLKDDDIKADAQDVARELQI